MNKIFNDGTGIVPEHLKQQFEDMIVNNYHEYLGQHDSFIRIDTPTVLYRIKFEISVDPLFLLIHILGYKEFPK